MIANEKKMMHRGQYTKQKQNINLCAYTCICLLSIFVMIHTTQCVGWLKKCWNFCVMWREKTIMIDYFKLDQWKPTHSMIDFGKRYSQMVLLFSVREFNLSLLWYPTQSVLIVSFIKTQMALDFHTYLFSLVLWTVRLCLSVDGCSFVRSSVHHA